MSDIKEAGASFNFPAKFVEEWDVIVDRTTAGLTCSRASRATLGSFRALLLLAFANAGFVARAANAGATSGASSASPPFDAGANSVMQPLLQIFSGFPFLTALAIAAPTAALVWILARKKAKRSLPDKPERTAARTDARSEKSLGKRYRALFENANDLIQGTGLDGRLLYVNTAWQDILDYNEQEIKSLSIFQVIHPESLESFKAGFERAVFGMKIKNIETTFVSKYGKRVIVEGSLHCELANEEPVAIQGIFRDITERKRSESALKQSEERFSRVFEASPIGIAISTLEGGRLLDANDSFLNMLGYKRIEVIGHVDLKLGFWESSEARAHIVLQMKQRHSVRDYQCKLRTQPGGIRDALISADLIEVNAEPCLLLMIHDITERLNLEAQLRQAQKMDGIGQLAAGVAHDFNNILTIIQGHANLLRTSDGMPAGIRESVEQVSVAADRAANLTRQLLTFCRKQAMLPKVMDMNETVTHVSKMLSRILGEDIALEVHEASHLPLINADSGMMELMIINMACNSRDAMPKGGSLTIATSCVDVTPAHVQQQPKARLGRHVRLTIADTGCGMSPETLRHIFEPFFTTKDVGKGTGLGLATVYGIVDQHHGWIEVTSERDRGTAFRIYLPEADKASVKAVEQKSEPVARSGKETILLVEDEVELRELARLVLEEYEYRVLEAGSGVQALKVWDQHKHEIEMLLTDMVMPEGMSGRELAERLQAEKPGIKVLYSSGYSPDVIGGCFKLPENSCFLAKPYHPPKLAQAVRECLDNARPSSAAQGPVGKAA
jgi:PAS domain S-box-containing protein